MLCRIVPSSLPYFSRSCLMVSIQSSFFILSRIDCVIICDTAHRIAIDNAETIVVDQGADSVDFRLVNLIGKGDIVITQDYGLAAMCLSKQAVVLNQDGKQYTEENISGLLEFRAIGKKIRRSGGRTKGMPKRTMQQNLDFESSLMKLLESVSIKRENG